MTDIPPPGPQRLSLIDPETRARLAAYWRKNVGYVAVLLTVWFVVSFGFGILLVEPLDRFTIPGTGFPLGFWFAQQGAIYVFVVLIFAYVWLMNRLDREFDVDEGDGDGAKTEGGGEGPGSLPIREGGTG